MTHEEARRMVEAELSSLTKAGLWTLMDGSQLVRSADIVAVRVVPAAGPPRMSASASV